MRLIDADALIENIGKIVPSTDYYEFASQICNAIRNQPTVYDVEKVVAELETKDELIEVLAKKLLNSEFGNCYMCKNPMKNITLDGANNGCDGQCNTLEKYTVDDFLKKIISELEVMKVGGEK